MAHYRMAHSHVFTTNLISNESVYLWLVATADGKISIGPDRQHAELPVDPIAIDATMIDGPIVECKQFKEECFDGAALVFDNDTGGFSFQDKKSIQSLISI